MRRKRRGREREREPSIRPMTGAFAKWSLEAAGAFLSFADGYRVDV